MDRTMRVAFSIVFFVFLIGVGEIVHGQATPAPSFQLGTEFWIVIVSGAITLGINLEQLRRVRADQKEVKQSLEARDAARDKADTKRDEHAATVNLRLQRIEDALDFLKQRRRTDRDEPARGTT